MLPKRSLAYALSGRTIKRLAKSAGRRLKRGRPKSTQRVQNKQLNDLIEATSAGLEGPDPWRQPDNRETISARAKGDGPRDHPERRC